MSYCRDKVAFHFRTPIVEWYVVWCDSKNGYQNRTRLDVIGLWVQNMIIILDSMVNIIGDLYEHLMNMKNFTLIN